MTLRTFLRVLRRHKFLVLVMVVIGAGLGYVTAPGESDEPPTYKASTTIIADQATAGETPYINLGQAALRVTAGEVPNRVAERLDLHVSDVRGDLFATADVKETESIQISATSLSPGTAEQISQTAGEELLELLNAEQEQLYDDLVADAEADVANRSEDLDLMAFLVNEDNIVTEDEQRELIRAEAQVGVALDKLQALLGRGSRPVGLSIIETSTATTFTEGGFAPPEGKPDRALFLGVFGLLLGIGGAVLLEQLDTRIRTRSDAEAGFGWPVVAEIPPRDKNHLEDEIVTVAHPASPVVESYRTLRTPLLLDADLVRNESTNGETAHRHSRVILVTSGLASEGKTSTAVELAAVLAEVGQKVLLVSADLRRPRAHKLFDLPAAPGMLDLFDDSEDATVLRDILHQTSIENVDLITSGAAHENPSPYLPKVRKLISSARRFYDFVIIDTAPLLAANDANELAASADVVLMLARSGKTTADAAKRVTELLEFGDGLVGVVLLGANDAGGGYSYYRYRYRYEAEVRKRGRGARRKKASESAREPVDASHR